MQWVEKRGGGGEEGDTEIPDKFSKRTTKYLLISLAKIAYKRMNNLTIYSRPYL
jgi:hypothetical protein